MEIHRFEAVWIAASLVLIVGFIATVTYGAVGVGVTMIGDGGQIADPENPTASPAFRDPGVYRQAADEYDVYVLAQQFYFAPGTQEPIRVPAGSTVTFYITSPDVIHGFEVAGTNVNVMAVPGQVSEITVRFEEPATYSIVCNEYCGSGHHTMAGQLRVVPRSQYDGGGA